MQVDFFNSGEIQARPMVPHELPFRDAKNDQSDFAKELVQEVHGSFKSANKSFKADRRQKFKIALVATQVIAVYLILVFVPLPTPWVLLLLANMVFWLSMWGFNLGHETAHNTIFKNHWASEISRISFDVIGFSSAVFRRKHVFFHHQYTNKRGVDGDMEDAYPLVRLSDYYEWRPYHRYQLWYILPAYSLLMLVWVWYDDWKRVANNKVAAAQMMPLTRIEKVLFIGWKIFTIFIFLGIPSLFHPFWKVLGCYILVHMGAGLMVGLIFQIAHIFKNCETLADYKFSSWYKDQAQQSRNFGTNHAFLNWYMGGLNFQIEHHLFPYISSCHYPGIQKIVKRVCQKHGVAYVEAPGFFQAIVDHLKTINVLGQPGAIKQKLSSASLG